MSKNRNRKFKRRKKMPKKRGIEHDKYWQLLTIILFLLGSGLAFVHSAFALLTFLFPITFGLLCADKVSRKLFGKGYEYYMDYSGKSMKWSDIVLSIPVLMAALYPMFIIGEVGDCYQGTEYWTATIGFCK